MVMTQTRRSSSRPPRFSWGLFFLLFTALGFLSFSYRYLDDLARGYVGTFPRRLLEEATGVYSVLLLLPLILRFARVYLFEKKGWLLLVSKHLAGAVAFSAAHTTIMAFSRHFLFPLVGQGPYDYGIMFFRYPMELSNDLISYTVFVTVFYYLERLRIAQAQQLAAAKLQTELAQAQLENLRLELQPHFLFNTLNTISSVMYEDVRAADAMITQLGDLLRLTRQASSTHETLFARALESGRLYLDVMPNRSESIVQASSAMRRWVNASLVTNFV